MRDHDIRTVLRRELATYCLRDSQARILEELGLGHGTVRADVVVVGELLHGFEIKSDRDDLDRLPMQARSYSAVFDRVTLVVAYSRAFEALEIVPDWWGVKLAELSEKGRVEISEARDPEDNPAPDPHEIAMLLWREEALALLEEHGAAAGVRSKPRSAVYARLVEAVGLDEIRARVRRQLASRPSWRAGAGRKRGGG